MSIENQEIALRGSWKFDGKKVLKDSVCERIEYLISNYLKKVASDSSGWNTLYQDPQDNRYWELIYPNSELHGGGPPSLINLSIAG